MEGGRQINQLWKPHFVYTCWELPAKKRETTSPCQKNPSFSLLINNSSLRLFQSWPWIEFGRSVASQILLLPLLSRSSSSLFSARLSPAKLHPSSLPPLLSHPPTPPHLLQLFTHLSHPFHTRVSVSSLLSSPSYSFSSPFSVNSWWRPNWTPTSCMWRGLESRWDHRKTLKGLILWVQSTSSSHLKLKLEKKRERERDCESIGGAPQQVLLPLSFPFPFRRGKNTKKQQLYTFNNGTSQLTRPNL